jgi:hypothetical protein
MLLVPTPGDEMMLALTPRLVRVRRIGCFVALALAVLSTGAAPTEARQATPDRNAPVKVDGSGAARIERLVVNRPAITDEFGRVPLLRATFAPGAELPPVFEIPERSEPIPYFFEEELLILVDSGAFAFTTEAETVAAGEGKRIELSVTTSLAIRNEGDVEGSLLMLRTAFNVIGRWPLNEFALNPVAPEGIVFDTVFKQQSLAARLMEVRISLDRVTLEPGDELGSLDLSGRGDAMAIHLRMEDGAIVGPEGSTEAEPLTPGSGGSASFKRPGDLAVRAVGSEPAVFLVVWVARAE